MNLKQKLSLISAGILPALALGAYFLIAPSRVAASNCPPGEVYAPCSSGHCSTGAACVGVGFHTVFVFCPPLGRGLGTCVSTGCVKCDE